MNKEITKEEIEKEIESLKQEYRKYMRDAINISNEMANLRKKLEGLPHE